MKLVDGNKIFIHRRNILASYCMSVVIGQGL